MSVPAAVTVPFRVSTPLDDDHDVVVRSFSGEEALSKLFRFRVEVSIRPYVPIVKLLGQNVTLTIEPRREEVREFPAKIASVEELGTDEHDESVYALELVPRIWELTQIVQARVFVDSKATDIIAQVFANRGVTLLTNLLGDERVRPYCVQYFESDFDFAVRLLEEEGYVYSCGHDETGQLTFTISGVPALLGDTDSVPFSDVATGSEPRISRWRTTRILGATSASAHDHFFQDAASPVLDGTAGIPSSPALPGWEPLDASWAASIDRYPGNFSHLFEEVNRSGVAAAPSGYKLFGNSRAWHDLRQVIGQTSANEGVSNTARLIPGLCFAMDGDSAPPGIHLVASVHHQGAQGLDHSTGGAQVLRYENRFVSVPYSEPMVYLPPRSTRKPFIHGCQTAIVVGGNSDDEIWTDKYGRVQVRFWWDGDEQRSCWVRVATPWAGSGWGIQHIPRVGQEVVVTFLDGDPDRPLIVGSVYNPSHLPPFEVPANKTQSGIRTCSTPKDDSGGSNEIRFEDKDGKEEIYIHAEKDRNEVVENDATRKVGHDSKDLVGNDRFDVVKGHLHAIAGGDKREAITGKSSVTIGGNSMNAVAHKLGIAAGDEIHLKAKKIVIEADTISLRTTETGREFIHIEKGGGITIDSKGEKVWINTGGAGSPDDGCYEEPDKPKNPFEPARKPKLPKLPWGPW